MRSCKRYLLAGAGVAAAMALSAAFAQAAAQQRSSQITFIPPADSVCADCEKPDGRPNASPPAGFQPLSASAQQLAHYGYPPRPDARKDPAGYAFWARLVSLPQQRVVPRQQATTLYNRPAMITSQNLRPVTPGGATGSKSGNWSGYAVVAHGKKTPFQAANTYVYGNFTVPVAQEAFGTCAGQVYSSEWVGIDGYGSNDVFQAGIEADAQCSNNKPSSFYSAWYEWFPKSETRVSSPAINPGNEIMLYIWNESRTVGDYYMLNVTTQKSSTLQFTAPSGTQLAGNSVEWIVERPGVGGGLATLTNYVSAPWWSARAAAPNGTGYSPANGGGGSNTLYSITMHDNNGGYISAPYTSPDRSMSYVAPDNSETLLPGTALWFFDEGTALNGQ